MEPLTNGSLGGIHFEKIGITILKSIGFFSGMGNIGFYIAVIIFKGTSYMEIMGRNYTSIGSSSFTLIFWLAEKKNVKLHLFDNPVKGMVLGVIAGIVWLAIPVLVMYVAKLSMLTELT